MTITVKQLVKAAENANKLGNLRDCSTLADLAGSVKKWGKLTSRQAEFAAALIERNSNEKASKIDEERENHRIKWQEDGAYREWVLFLATFFATSGQTAYQHHIHNRQRNARRVLQASRDAEGGVPSLDDCNRLTTSKLAPRLRDTFEKPLLYSVGDLVQVRASELRYGERAKGLGEQMGWIIDTNARNVHRVATYSKTKGGTRIYKVMFPSGEQYREERQLKLVSRKNHNKE
tara:strand:+ start:1076 stop:1774 length:699 start_codon:yes stop_codon:yes gene_type:complete